MGVREQLRLNNHSTPAEDTFANRKVVWEDVTDHAPSGGQPHSERPDRTGPDPKTLIYVNCSRAFSRIQKAPAVGTYLGPPPRNIARMSSTETVLDCASLTLGIALNACPYTTSTVIDR